MTAPHHCNTPPAADSSAASCLPGVQRSAYNASHTIAAIVQLRRICPVPNTIAMHQALQLTLPFDDHPSSGAAIGPTIYTLGYAGWAPGKAESKKLKAEIIAASSALAAFSAFSFQISAFPAAAPTPHAAIEASPPPSSPSAWAAQSSTYRHPSARSAVTAISLGCLGCEETA